MVMQFIQRLMLAAEMVLFLCPHLSFALDKTTTPDKSGYSLFNPTPVELMREMITDRPDTTESPYSVDAGHLQFELSFFGGSYNRDWGDAQQSLQILPSNIKVGLINNVDIQFVFTPFERIKESDRNAREGFSDQTQVRLKINLWGNDGGETALAVMPYIKLPTGSRGLSNDHLEGGVIIPYATSLPGDFALGMMAEIDFLYDPVELRYKSDFVHTATVGHDITDNLACYIEYVGVAPENFNQVYQANASGGLTYAMTDDWVLDAGGTIGLSEDTEDVTYFLGTSFRI